MKHEIEQLKKRIAELEARVERSFEKGEWVIGDSALFNRQWLLRFDHKDDRGRYIATEAIDPDDGYYDRGAERVFTLIDARRATKDEIEEGLRAVWARRCKEAGWDDPDEAEIEAHADGRTGRVNSGTLGPVYGPQSDNLWTKNGRVYGKGRWATPKQREKAIEVNGYEAEFHEGYVQFGCAKIDNRIFKQIGYMLDSYAPHPTDGKSLEGFKIGEGVFTIEQIQEIITRLRD